MSQHTKGIWHDDHVGGGSSFRFRVYAHEREIAMLWHHPGQHPTTDAHTQELADARLIAAAPELLEAAKHAAMEWRLHGQLTDSARVLEAAIAKAEGRGTR